MMKAYRPTGRATAKNTQPGSRAAARVVQAIRPRTSRAVEGRPGTSASSMRSARRDATGGADARPVLPRAGSQPKARTATRDAAKVHAVITASAPRSQPPPAANGSNCSCTASANGFSGKTAAIESAHPGMSPTMNSPDTNPSATAAAIDTASATAAVGDSAATARPSAAKQAIPTAIVTTVAGAVRHRICTS